MIETTVVNVSTRAILKVCANRNVDRAQLLTDVGIDSRLVEKPGARIPLAQVFALAAEARRRTRDETISLHAAELTPFGAYRIIDHLALASATPREALHKAARYLRLIIGTSELATRMRRDQAQIELHSPGAPEGLPHQYVEYTFTSLLVRFRFTTGLNWRPREVHFTAPEPADLTEYHRVFQAPIRFQQPVNRLVFDRAMVDLPHPQADPALCETLDHHAQRLLDQLPLEDGFLSEVRSAVSEGIERRDLGLNTMARKLAMSRRALQRRLSGCGTSYREILDQARYELTLRLLRELPSGPEEISFLLGFSEPRAFYRAFKRWTGKTPQAYLGR
jgi:AraC-like DNA-binding protein